MTRKSDEKAVAQITEQATDRFRTFGGGRKSAWGNPLAAALADQKPMFAAGVDVEEVVRFVIDNYRAIESSKSN